MKTFLAFLLGAVVGWMGSQVYLERRVEHSPARASLGEKEGAAGSTVVEETRRVGDRIEDKLSQWKLGPEDVKIDLRQSGRVVRSRARDLASEVSDQWIEGKIAGKIALDPDLSTRRIQVECQDGRVVLEGQAATPDLIGHAVALALDTDGVREVESRLTLLEVPRTDAAATGAGTTHSG